MNYNGNSPKLDLKLNLSPPRANPPSPIRSVSSTEMSPPNSCVSLEHSRDEGFRFSSSPEVTSMMLAGCPKCFIYLMVPEEDPKCPQCKAKVLLEFLHDQRPNNSKE